jgi:cytochrome c5
MTFLKYSLVSATLLFTAAIAPAQSLPEGDGKKLVEDVCGSCHGVELVTDKKMNKDDWTAVVSSMVDKGAALSKEDAAKVVNYLAANFGDKKLADNNARELKEKQLKGKELAESICTLCHEFNRVRTQELTREEWAGEIKGMISEGAPVTDQEFAVLVDYLAANFGPRKPEAKR